MAFVNEVVSDSDIDKYGLPFKKGSGRYWTRDVERDMYLWGGLSGNPAHGEDIEGRFYLYVGGMEIYIVVLPGTWSAKFSESPYVISWKSLEHVRPSDLGKIRKDRFLEILKEALTVYGRNGRENRYTPTRIIKFEF